MKFKFLTLFFVGGLITFTSCNKNKQEDMSSNPKTQSTQNLDQYGISHNAKLDYVAANISDLASSSFSQRLAAANAYSDPTFGNPSSTTLSDAQAGITYAETIIEDFDAAGQILASDGHITSEMSIYYDELGVLLENARNNFLNEVYYTPETFSSDVDLIIADIYDNHTVTVNQSTGEGSEAGKAVITMEIAKASYAYWYEAALDNSTSPWASYFQTNYKKPGFWDRLWTGVKRVAVDIYSFPSCPYCGGAGTGEPYDLNKAWDYSGDQSSDVD